MKNENISALLLEKQHLIEEFRYRQALSMRKFETLCRKKNQAERDKIVAYFKTEGGEMREHGYYSPAREKLLKFLTGKSYWDYSFEQRFKARLGLYKFLNRKEAEALILAYYYAQPFEREDFRNCIFCGSAPHITGEDLDKMTRHPELKKKSTVALGEELYKMKDLVFYQPEGPLNLFRRFSGLPAKQKQDIQRFCVQAGQRVLNHITIDTGIRYLQQNLLPYCFADTRAAVQPDDDKKMCDLYLKARQSHGEKANRMKDLIGVFAYMFLTQSKENKLLYYSQLYPQKRPKVKLGHLPCARCNGLDD